MLQPGDQVGRYRVVRAVGKGGMARVYLVQDGEDGSSWALKVLTLDEPGLVERFVDEAQMQSTLDHPNLVRARELHSVGPRLGIVMQFVEGPTLDQWLHDNPEATERQRLDLAQGILAGVGAAHQAGLVHRDLKPGNVLLEPNGDGWVPRVTDFGLAKLKGVGSRTQTGVAMGTPRYMAPEQIMDAKSVDSRADVYALGALFYELFTGRPAFGHATFAEAYQALKEAGYRDPVELGVSKRVSAAIRKALEPDVEARVQSCRDLSDLLDGRAPYSVRRRRWRLVRFLLVFAVLAIAALAWRFGDPNLILQWWSTIR